MKHTYFYAAAVVIAHLVWWLLFWGTIIYIGAHFIGKFW
jgi:hypothetical protein